MTIDESTSCKRQLSEGEKKLLATLDSLFLLQHLKSDTISSLMDIHSMLSEMDWNSLLHRTAPTGPVGSHHRAPGRDDTSSLLSKTSAIDSGLGRASASTSASQNVYHIYSNVPPVPVSSSHRPVRGDSSSIDKPPESPPPSAPSTGMSFISPYLQSPGSSPTPPASYDSTHSLAMQVITSLTPEWISEAQQLCHLLSNPHLKLLFKISDIVATKDYNNSFLYSFPFKPIINQINTATDEMSHQDKHTYCNVSFASSNRSLARECASSISQSILLPSSSTSSMLHHFTGEQDVSDENYHRSMENIILIDANKDDHIERRTPQEEKEVICSPSNGTTDHRTHSPQRKHTVSIKKSKPLSGKDAIVPSTASVNSARGASTNVLGDDNTHTHSPVGGVRPKSITLHHKVLSSDTHHRLKERTLHTASNFFKLPCIPRSTCIKGHMRQETTSPLLENNSIEHCNPIYQSIGSHLHAPSCGTDGHGKSSRNTYHHYSIIDSNDDNYYYNWDYYDVTGNSVRPTKLVSIHKGLEPLGITFTIVDGKKCHHVIVSRVIYDSPVYRCGQVTPGDLIIEVNGINLKNRSHRAIVHILERESNRDEVTFKLICISVDSAAAALSVGPPENAIYSNLIGPTGTPVTGVSDVTDNGKTPSPTHPSSDVTAERKKLLVTLDMVDRITSGRQVGTDDRLFTDETTAAPIDTSIKSHGNQGLKCNTQPSSAALTTSSSHTIDSCDLVTHGPNVYVRAHFDYNPWLDRSHPCPEVGLVFKKGAVLQIVNQTDDSDWWQARHEDSLGYTCRVGIIPSSSYYESRIATIRDAKRLRRMNEKVKLCSGFKSPIKRSTWSKKVKKIMYKSTQMELFEESDIPTYEEVIHLYPTPGFCRPIIFFGSSLVGISKLLRRLKQTDPYTYVAPVAHTTRSPRVDNDDDTVTSSDYLYISREQFLSELIAGSFIEWDEYNGHLYGIHRETVRSIIASGCVCIMTVQASGLKSVRNCLFKPYVIFFKPDTSAVVQAETDEIISFFGSTAYTDVNDHQSGDDTFNTRRDDDKCAPCDEGNGELYHHHPQTGQVNGLTINAHSTPGNQYSNVINVSSKLTSVNGNVNAKTRDEPCNLLSSVANYTYDYYGVRGCKFKRNHFRNLDCNQRRHLLLESAQLEYLYSHYFDTITVIGDDFQDVLLQVISTIRDLQQLPQWVPASWL